MSETATHPIENQILTTLIQSVLQETDYLLMPPETSYTRPRDPFSPTTFEKKMLMLEWQQHLQLREAGFARQTFLTVAESDGVLKNETFNFLRMAEKHLLTTDYTYDILRVLAVAFIYVSHALNPERPSPNDVFYPVDMTERMQRYGEMCLDGDNYTQEERAQHRDYFVNIWQESVAISLAHKEMQQGKLQNGISYVDDIGRNFRFSRLERDLAEGKLLLQTILGNEPFSLEKAIASLDIMPPKRERQKGIISLSELVG